MATSSCKRKVGSDQLSYSIVQKIAEQKGKAASQLDPPLYEVIDLDALDLLFREGNERNQNWQLSFEYYGCEIGVSSDGSILVQDSDTVPTIEQTRNE